MADQEPLVIVDIWEEIIAAADAVLFPTLNKHLLYEYGRSIQILKKLLQLNTAIDTATKNSKYPLVALQQPFREVSATGYYCTVKFPSITIATLTESTDPTPKRYAQTFKPILYPIWEEIKRQIVKHRNVVGNDPGAIQIDGKMDLPGTDPISDGVKGISNNDIVDAIIIQGLQLTFKQVNNCKKFLIN